MLETALNVFQHTHNSPRASAASAFSPLPAGIPDPRRGRIGGRRGIAAPYPEGSRHADVAKKRIETDFAFVGLVEHWGASVCLYHATFGGRAASKVELRNLRPGGYEAPENLASLRQGPGQGLGGHAAENLRRDFVVYAAGKSKFLSDLAARAGVD